MLTSYFMYFFMVCTIFLGIWVIKLLGKGENGHHDDAKTASSGDVTVNPRYFRRVPKQAANQEGAGGDVTVNPPPPIVSQQAPSVNTEEPIRPLICDLEKGAAATKLTKKQREMIVWFASAVYHLKNNNLTPQKISATMTFIFGKIVKLSDSIAIFNHLLENGIIGEANGKYHLGVEKCVLEQFIGNKLIVVAKKTTQVQDENKTKKPPSNKPQEESKVAQEGEKVHDVKQTQPPPAEKKEAEQQK